MREHALQPGHILTGTLFREPMRVESVRAHGAGVWEVGLVGIQSERFRKVTLTSRDIEALAVQESLPTYAGDGRLLRLGLQAYMLSIAHEFDPYFGLSISRVDPLPHQLEAVYDYLLKLAQVRFLLADDAGAGKTIMAGLLIRELKLRGLVERLLIVCPANLAFQWQRELKEKFDETFLVLKGSDIRDQFGVNQWLEHNQIITSLDLAKRDEILSGLRQVHWDLAIVDEAHRMSWTPPTRKTARYALGELIRDATDHLLLLTATPHKGDPTNFSLFLQLLDRDAYADVHSLRVAMDHGQAPFYLRRTKEAMVYFPERQSNGRAAAEIDQSVPGAEGRLAQAEAHHAEPLYRRERRRQELQHQRAVSLQGVERIASALILPHPERETPEVRRLRPNAETEATAMRVVMEHERAQGREVYDVHEKNLGYDITSLDLNSGELRLIEVKGLGAATGSILLTPNERRVAEDRRDCYWLYVVTNCNDTPQLQPPIKDPARFPWHEVSQVQHYWLEVDALTQPMQVREEAQDYPR